MCLTIGTQNVDIDEVLLVPFWVQTFHKKFNFDRYPFVLGHDLIQHLRNMLHRIDQKECEFKFDSEVQLISIHNEKERGVLEYYYAPCT